MCKITKIPSTRIDVVETFLKVDKNNNGYLNLAELKTLAKYLLEESTYVTDESSVLDILNWFVDTSSGVVHYDDILKNGERINQALDDYLFM